MAKVKAKASKLWLQGCGDCEACNRDNCGTCRNCKDMPKFGGANRLRQRCEERKCLKGTHGRHKIMKHDQDSGAAAKGLSPAPTPAAAAAAADISTLIPMVRAPPLAQANNSDENELADENDGGNEQMAAAVDDSSDSEEAPIERVKRRSADADATATTANSDKPRGRTKAQKKEFIQTKESAAAGQGQVANQEADLQKKLGDRLRNGKHEDKTTEIQISEGKAKHSIMRRDKRLKRDIKPFSKSQEGKEIRLSQLRFDRKGPGLGKALLQSLACYDTEQDASALPHCHQCRTHCQGEADSGSICQFIGFRKIIFRDGAFRAAGFLDPFADPKPKDSELWMPIKGLLPAGVKLDEKSARFILWHVQEPFCKLVEEEEGIIRDYVGGGGGRKVIWKRMQEKTREMCDVCCTTLFNAHWTCDQCGMSVCIDCRKVRRTGRAELAKPYRPVQGKDRDHQMWPLCGNNVAHDDLDALLLTVMIVGDTLSHLRDLVVKVREEKGFGSDALAQEEEAPKDVVAVQPLTAAAEVDESNSPAMKKQKLSGCNSRCSVTITPALVRDYKRTRTIPDSSIKPLDLPPPSSLPDADGGGGGGGGSLATRAELDAEVENQIAETRRRSRPNAESGSDDALKTPQWLCDGKLLLLLDPTDQNSVRLFQNQWKCGQPVMIANSSQQLHSNLWTPASFKRNYGKLRHDLINCLTGDILPNARLGDFWNGFELISERPKDKSGRPMLLKLKDWPPKEDMASYMPSRFNDLINSFPMPAYTLRNGTLNLASYMPDCFLKPDLGPKMYIAYGSALYSDKGSTNLHIDMSDAVNILVYVGLAKDTLALELMEVYTEIDEAGCDIIMKQRSRNHMPGALWHIFHPADTVKIREFLNKVALENGKRLDPHDDPIHDQSTYLDGPLRSRLYKEYGVQDYAIVQSQGDMVFIPAGAAHQVRNLNNCIKAAEDFVSPENLGKCLHLTQEFRHLTQWHSNHEDKLQIKSILYHAVKSAVTVMAGEREAVEFMLKRQAATRANASRMSPDIWQVEDRAKLKPNVHVTSGRDATKRALPSYAFALSPAPAAAGMTQVADSSNMNHKARVANMISIKEQLQRDHRDEITSLNAEHNKQIETINSDHRDEITSLNAEHNKQIDTINSDNMEENVKAEHNSQIESINGEHREEKKSMEDEHNSQIESINGEHREEKKSMEDKHNRQIESINGEHREEKNSMEDEHNRQIESINREHREEKRSMEDEHNSQIETLNGEYRDEKKSMEDEQKKKIKTLNVDHTKQRATMKAGYNNKIEAMIEQLTQLTQTWRRT